MSTAGQTYALRALYGEKSDAQCQFLELPHHLTPTGLLFAALSVDVASFENFFPGLETLLNKFDFASLPHRRSIAYEGNFNWKTM